MIGKLFAAVIGRWQLSLGILAAVVLALSLSYCKGRSDGAAINEAKHARAAAQAVAQARKADAVAVDTAQAGKASVEEGNDRAQEAARNSDDPLRAGLDSLR